MNRRTVAILILAALAIHVWPFFLWLSNTGAHENAFVLPFQNTTSGRKKPFMTEKFIIPDQGDRMVHVASLCEMPGGKFVAAWYGGTREGAKDVAIFLSFLDPRKEGSWTEPEVVVDRISASKELYRYIKKVGNPVVFSDPMDRLWMIFVTIPFGGWSCSSLNVKISNDGGDTWTDTTRLTLSPFLNISELVRNNPVLLRDGRFGVPIYHEFIGYFPEILWIKVKKGQDACIEYGKTRIIGGRDYIQPAIAVSNELSACAFYRCRSEKRKVGMGTTVDGGATWSAARKLEQANPDASLDVVTLSDGRFLMAYNDSFNKRENLKLALSNDRGKTWQAVATLENSPGHEFSYPYMIKSRSGDVHLVYTWKRKRIKHVVFNEAWIHSMEKTSVEKREHQ